MSLSAIRCSEVDEGVRYRGRRRAGVAGRLALLRAVVLAEEREVMRTRSPSVAAEVARILNGEKVLPARVDTQSPLSTYSVSRAGTDPELFLIVALEPTRSNPGRFGLGGVLASTPHEDLAREVAAMLNRIDPRARPRGTRGFGWF